MMSDGCKDCSDCTGGGCYSPTDYVLAIGELDVERYEAPNPSPLVEFWIGREGEPVQVNSAEAGIIVTVRGATKELVVDINGRDIVFPMRTTVSLVADPSKGCIVRQEDDNE